MTTDSDIIQQNPMDKRYENLAQRYESLSKKLQIQSLIDQKKHEQLMESMKRTNEKILKTASDLAYHPTVENPEPASERSELRRQAKKDKASEFDPLRYWIVSKKGL